MNDIRTCVSAPSIFDRTYASDTESIELDDTFCMSSEENLETAHSRDSNVEDAAADDEKTARSISSDRSVPIATCDSAASLRTADNAEIQTSRSPNASLRECPSTETCGSAASDAINTCMDSMLTAVEDSELMAILSEHLLRTANSQDWDNATCRSIGSSSSTEDTCMDLELTAVEDRELMAILSEMLLRTANSQESVGTANSVQSCAMEDLTTANAVLSQEAIDELGRTPSFYCMDDNSGSITFSLPFAVPSQYQLAELHTYSGLQNPDTAYQYRLQEVLPPNSSPMISATKSEYLLPGMPE